MPRVARAESLLARLHEMVLVLDAGGVIRYANEATETMLGYTRADKIGTNAFELVHPEDVAPGMEALVGVNATPEGRGGGIELRVRHADGSWRLLELSANNQLDDPEIAGIIVTGRAVGEGPSNDEVLREAERRLNAAFDGASIGMALVSLDSRFIRVNRALCDLLGYSFEELLTKRATDVTHPDDLDADRTAVDRVRAGAVGTHVLEKRYLRRDGTVVWARTAISLVRDDDGEPVYLTKQILDITDLREAEEAVQTASARFRALVQHAYDLVAVTGHGGRFEYVSPSVERFLGYRPEELLGRRARELFHPDEADEILEDINAQLDGPAPHQPFECRLRHHDGSWRYFEMTLTDARDDPAVGGLVINAREVTERRATEVRVRALFESAQDIITILRPDGSSASNPTAERILGLSLETEGGLLELVHPDDLEVARRTLEEVKSGARGSRDPVELRLRDADGAYRPFECVAQDLTDDPAIGGIVVLARDVTERHEAATALRVAENRFRAAFERSPVGILLVSPEGLVIDANAAYCAMLGREPSELIGGQALNDVHPDDREKMTIDGARRAEGYISASSDPVRLVDTKGDNHWVLWDASVVRDEAGKTQYVVALAADVTDQRHTQEALHHSEVWFRALVQHSSDVVCVIGLDGVMRYVSPSVRRVLGFEPEEMIGREGRELIHPDDYESLAAEMTRQLEPNAERSAVEYRQRRRDGSWAWFEATASPLPGDIGLEALVVNARNISDRKQAEAERAEIEARFQDAFATSPIGIAFIDLRGKLAWANEALAHMIGMPRSEIERMTVDDLSRPEDLEYNSEHLRQLIAGEIPSFTSEKRYEHDDGRVAWGMLYISLLRDASGAPKYVLCQVEDITERKKRELELAHDAEHDVLTGLWNRAGMRRLLADAWAHRTTEQPLALLFVDLDGFKEVNDIHGHEAGDEVLVHVARRLRTAVRGGDVVARWGGDEFVVVCRHVSGAKEAESVAKRICRAVSAPFSMTSGEVTIGASVGVAIDGGHNTPQQLLGDADAATYRAKRSGRSSVELAGSP